jgi:hypothetical protein
MEDEVPTFRIFIDNQNYLAIMGFPEDRSDEDIRVENISGLWPNHTRFVMHGGHEIVLNMALGELWKHPSPMDVEGTLHAART